MAGKPVTTEVRQRDVQDIVERLWLAAELKVLSPRRAFNVNDAVDVALFLTDKLFKGAGVAVRTTLSPGLPEADAQMGHVEQSLIDVLLNSCEASSRGGEVRVATGYAEQGKGVEIRIEDSGEGIPPEALGRVFEPFYSTRGRLGLGLTAARELLSRSGGDIRIESDPGKGTTVTLTLPVVKGPAS